MTQESSITDEMRAAIGVQSEPAFNEVEKGAIRKFAQAVGDPNPLWQDEEHAKKGPHGRIVAPPTFLVTMTSGRSNRPAGATARPAMRRGLLDGGAEWEFYVPVGPGDVIKCTSALADLYERPGRMGTMLFTVTEQTYTNQKGELVAKRRGTVITF